jgi:hypothetical protein
MSSSRHGPLARLKVPALAAVSAALSTLPVAASARHLTIDETKRHAVQRIQYGGSLRENAADVARARTGRARDRSQPRRRSTRRA